MAILCNAATMSISPLDSMTKLQRIEALGLLPVLERIAKNNFATVKEVVSKSKQASLATARAEFYLYCRQLGMSYPRIGYLLGRDHTTVLVALRRFGKNPKQLKLSDGSK